MLAAPAETNPRLRSAPAACAGGEAPLDRAARALDRVAAAAGRLVARGRARWLAVRAARGLRRAPRPLRLCLGSGGAPIAGWTNVDLDRRADVRLDLRWPLPVPAGSARHVYSEHVLEHLGRTDGLALLRECRRVLDDDGVLRIATPDLAELVAAYQGDWRAQDWVGWPGHEWVDSPARMLNAALREWGHRHVYDFAELERALRAAGFSEVVRCALGASAHRELAGLETRLDSTLICEARGRAAPVGS